MCFVNKGVIGVYREFIFSYQMHVFCFKHTQKIMYFYDLSFNSRLTIY